MCGISGIIETNKVVQIDKKYHIEQINKTMHHRGPDSNGCWVDNKNRVGFGHCRLSIIDLSDSEECRSFGFQIPQYGDTQPKPGREDELTKRESEAKKRKKEFEKNFEMVDLEGGSWTIQVPRRKTK